jgi:hypothetical protein
MPTPGSASETAPLQIQIPDAGSGQTGSFVIYAWNSFYSSYNEAMTAGPGLAQITPFEFGPGNHVSEQPIFPGLSIIIIPEPAPVMLGLAGAGVLLFRRLRHYRLIVARVYRS